MLVSLVKIFGVYKIMKFLDAVNPDGLAEVLRVKKFMKTKDLNLLGKSVFIEQNKEKTKHIIVFEFAFTTKEECEIFRDMHKLAEKSNALGSSRD